MVMCDDCRIWYHQACCAAEDVDESQTYTCVKCKGWHNHLQDNLLDIIFKRKSFEQLLNEERLYWAGFDSLSNYMEDSDLAL